MATVPTQFDLHSAVALAGYLGRHPLFDHCVDSALQHHVLGGIPFAATFFYFWTQAEREHREDNLRRLITILLGSLVAIALALLAARMISWLPPQRQPGLAHLYPSYLVPDVNTNSFPSDSTALFTSIAAGLVSLDLVTGVVMLLAVPLIISLPRMYVGGHYVTDVLAGLLIGFMGYGISRVAFDRDFSKQILKTGSQPHYPRLLLETCVFLWILEVAVGFREGVWIVSAVHYFRQFGR
jgi:hypothetical protein